MSASETVKTETSPPTKMEVSREVILLESYRVAEPGGSPP